MKIRFIVYEIDYPDNRVAREVGDQTSHYNQPGAVLFTDGRRYETEGEAEEAIAKNVRGNFAILKVYER